LIILFPLLGALVNGVVGKRLSRGLNAVIGCLTVGLSFALAAVVFRELLLLGPDDRTISFKLFTWIESADLTVDAAFLLDPLSTVMILVVTGVGFLIHIYSVAYMADEPGYYRFFSYLNLFIFMMSILVLADNYLLMFVGWEGVGLCSYLLIGFYFERKSAGDAAKKAFIVNRIGDVGFILGAFLIFRTFGTFNYLQVFERASEQFPSPEVGFGILSAICLLLFVGAAGKSAQIPLYVWLPDAMEGPTPVSALIHAATMVTAGVYMIARSSALFSRAPETLLIVAVIGVATATLAACIALVQTDIKRVLAYSTVSQLGYMFLAAGVGAFGAGIFHHVTHAFFKALLFLGSGSVILALHHEQDLFRMGGLKKYLPATFWTMWIASLAISGVPPLSGFFSKDEILFNAFLLGHVVLWVIGILVAALTAFYMSRLMFLTFHGTRRTGTTDDHGGHGEHGHAPKEPSFLMTGPLMILAILAAVAGFVGLPAYLGGSWLEHFLEPSFALRYVQTAGGEHHSLSSEIALTVIAVLAGLTGIVIAYYAYLRDPELPGRVAGRLSGLYSAARQKFYVDEIYDRLIVWPIQRLSDVVLWRVIDVHVIDGLVNGAGGLVQYWSSGLRRIQNGYTRSYAAWVLLGAVLIFIYYYVVTA
ncbi:MAG: NADH-quinone oxidoreductase subunit L, partial [Acidobacteria bacterium]